MNISNPLRRVCAAGLCLSLCLCGCTLLEGGDTVQDAGETPQATHRVDIAQPESIDTAGGREDTAVYSQDDPDSLVYFYVTVRMGTEAEGTNHTFDEVKNAIRFVNSAHVDNSVYAEALVQVGDENGPVSGMLGYGQSASNATIRIRGNSSTTMPLKSYKLSLDDDAGLWRGQSNIALNKHAFDSSRLRNKLYFDLLREVPEVPSLRTQFVRLFIKDETAGQTEFEDYGVYTQVEVPGKKYLGNHGLDTSGYLYKAISFNFEMKEGLKNFDDPEFDPEVFKTILNCKGRQDNARLIEMVEAVNDMTRDINEVVDTYFDRDNYIAWMAFNILMGNIDTTEQNFYLYSPLNSQKWYFIPWDSDASLYRQERELKGGSGDYDDWESGLSSYWGVMLHQRFLKVEQNRLDLAAKVEEFYQQFSPQRVQALADSYNQVIRQDLYHMPDLLNLTVTTDEREELLGSIGEEITINYDLFQKSLNALMPFWQWSEDRGDTVHLSWGEAYDFQAKSVTYQVTVSQFPDMSNPVYQESGLSQLEVDLPKTVLTPGTYYMKVEATSEDGRVTRSMDKSQVNGAYYPGVYQFTVN